MFKKIVGLIIAIGVSALVNNIYQKHQAAEAAQGMAKFLNDNYSSRMVDDITRFDHADAKGTEVEASYTFVNIDDSSELGDLDQLHQAMYQNIKSHDCGGEKIRYALKKGLTFSYSYKDSQGNDIFHISVKNSDCSS